jgi:hypothetical protein
MIISLRTFAVLPWQWSTTSQTADSILGKLPGFGFKLYIGAVKQLEGRTCGELSPNLDDERGQAAVA